MTMHANLKENTLSSNIHEVGLVVGVWALQSANFFITSLNIGVTLYIIYYFAWFVSGKREQHCHQLHNNPT